MIYVTKKRSNLFYFLVGTLSVLFFIMGATSFALIVPAMYSLDPFLGIYGVMSTFACFYTAYQLMMMR